MPIKAKTPNFILASSSQYRKEQLAKIIPQFDSIKPDVDETPGKHEQPEALAIRLAKSKCCKVVPTKQNTVVIGSDQTAACESVPLTKPGIASRAREQLLLCSGKEIIFYTALCVQFDGAFYEYCDRTTVKFRTLTTEEIEGYITLDQPINCAGSFKCEGLGITLFESISTKDPSALIGLPMIALNNILLEIGINVLTLNLTNND